MHNPPELKQAAVRELARRAGFREMELDLTGDSVMALFDLVVEECARAAELQARHYSGDGNESTGCLNSAAAVRGYGSTIGSIEEVRYVIGPQYR